MAKSTRKTIYMDYAASAEPNPSSIHDAGIKAKKELESARKAVADVLGARPEEIIFTSGGTESNNLAILGMGGGHMITTNIEHPSVLGTMGRFTDVSVLPVGENGIFDPKRIKNALKKNTVLVSVMYANNEIGTIQPIREIAKEIRHWRKMNKSPFPYLHTDSVQAANYLNLNVERLGVDMMSLSGSKISGAGKVGALYKRKSVLLTPVFGGGSQEFGFRPGTENLPEIVKFANALTMAQKNRGKESRRLLKLRDYFIGQLPKDIIINGDLENRLPNNVNITVPNIPSDLLVIELSAKGIMVSEKSACKSGDKRASHVIEALRKDNTGSLRFSFGKATTKAGVDYTLQILEEILKKYKQWYN